MKQKGIAGVLGLIFGIFGVHHFYLGHRARGIMHFLLFLFTFAITVEEGVPMIMLPALIGFIGGILLLVMPQEEFDEKYNAKYLGLPSPSRRRPQYSRPVAANRDKIELQELKSEGIKAFRGRDYEGASEAFLDALEIAPNDPSLHFNLACCYSHMKIVDLVDEHLVEALENGFSRWDKIDNHPSLKWYREQDAYIKLLKQYQNKDKGKVKEVKIEDKEEPNLELNPDNELPPINTGNLLEQITRLGELREKGFLTDEEFAEQKKKILRS